MDVQVAMVTVPKDQALGMISCLPACPLFAAGLPLGMGWGTL